MREIERVLAAAGCAHIVVPFCHPFHECPKDFLDGLKELDGDVEIVAEGWRTGPTATMLVFVCSRCDTWITCFFKGSNAGRIRNHCNVWLRKLRAEDSR